ncbi:hypothetical protein [Cohnella zeiphila]|uniref:Uncharacterized protein n=1 Tax=Cohnella zeiphila TaxID=2761120 RepID=A0A7X0SH54_9BACL|nr:hypothetical protein [Cohnella zeiphila]MBB6729897.1 hypothetical protein [Cohnella zeiphila]
MRAVSASTKSTPDSAAGHSASQRSAANRPAASSPASAPLNLADASVLQRLQQSVGNQGVLQLMRSRAPLAAPGEKTDRGSASGRAPVLQRQVAAQILPNKNAPEKLGRLVIAGRPDRVFGKSMGDHTTAFSVHEAAIRMRVEGRTPAEAIQAMLELAESTFSLPGMNLVSQLPEGHLAKYNDALKHLLSFRGPLKAAVASSRDSATETASDVAMNATPSAPPVTANDNASGVSAGPPTVAMTDTNGVTGGPPTVAMTDTNGVSAAVPSASEPDHSGAILLLQAFIGAYLHFRELMPLSVINVMEKSPSLAGKGKGESGKAKLLADHQPGNWQDKDQLLDAILSLFDASSVALAAIEGNADLAQKMAPGTKPLNPATRMRFAILQHVQTIKISFPLVFSGEQKLEEAAVVDALEREVALEEGGWLEWQRELNDKKKGKKQERIDKLKENIDLRKLETANWTARVPTDIPKWSTEKEKEERELNRLDESNAWVRSLEEKHTKKMEQFRKADDLKGETAEKTNESAKVRHEVSDKDVESPDNGGTGSAVSAAATEAAAAAEEALERKQPIATQVLLDDKGKISEIRSAGRTPSPFSGTMGAHTTAWIVHLDRIRKELIRSSVDEAHGKMRDVLVPEAEARAKSLKEEFPEVVDGQADRLAELKKAKKYDTPLQGALILQQYINDLLTYINYSPGSTLAAADVGGKSEGMRRQVLVQHEDGNRQSKERLLWAIFGLIDVKAAPTDSRAKLLDEHLSLIEQTYPDSFKDSGADDEIDWEKDVSDTIRSRARTGKNRFEDDNEAPKAKKKARLDGTGSQTGKTDGASGKLPDPFGLFSEQRPSRPLVDDAGAILPEAQARFLSAYRKDVTESAAFLTEAEGHLVASRLGIQVRVYRGEAPKDFRKLDNPGGGHCLIHALVQIAKASGGHDPGSGAPPDQIAEMRSLMAARLSDEQILTLSAAAIHARMRGEDEPGLGPEMLSLLNDTSVLQASIKFWERKTTEAATTTSSDKDKEKGTGTPPGNSTDSTNSGGEAASPMQVETATPLVAMGAGRPVQERLALLHTGGAHYVMIVRD